MQKIVKYTIIINIALSLLFAYFNYVIWNLFNGNNIAHSSIITSGWNPFFISVMFHSYSNGNFDTMQTVFSYINTPFLLFWILMAVNMAVILKLQSVNKTEKTGKAI